MKKALFLLVLFAPLSLFSLSTLAHKPSDSYLTIQIEGASIEGQWDIALRDLEHAIGLDANQNGLITWGELRDRHAGISAYALSRLEITQNGNPCSTHPIQHLVDEHSDGTYAILKFSIECPQKKGALHFVYNLLFEFDQLHRGLLRIVQQGGTQTFIFSPTNRSFTLNLGEYSWWMEFQRFGREGIWHILNGYDHLLFLLSLLLPSVMIWETGQWKATSSFHLAFWEVVKIVTAFTLAHSFTLTLAAFGIINLPSRWVESTIAASVLIAALHNFYPIIRTRLWLVAFGFGLVHGLGFASVLLDLGLTGRTLWPTLGGFNLGVETGQMIIVAVFFPLAFCSRKTWWYQTLGLRVGSLLIVMVAFMWLVERSLNIRLGLKF